MQAGNLIATRPKRDRDARREAILDVAQEVFMQEGFAAASMSTIAARLGGSKGTLYNYFKSKEELFGAYVEHRCMWNHEEVLADRTPGETVQEVLYRLGRAFLAHLLSDTNLRNFRLISAEAARNPEIGRTFYEAGPQRGIDRLAGIMAGMAQAGELQVDDITDAANQFLGLVQNRYFKARLCNSIPELTQKQIDDEAALAVRTFLRAFAPRT